MDLETVRRQVTRCTKCDLCKTRTNAVPGKGNFQSDVIFVGEAPGRSEDGQGEPFVGAAGKRLSAALEEAGVSRDDTYITNVVKCRPPDNRVPSATERDTCGGYLKEEIAIIKPKIICILGNTAYGSILGGSEITKYRGKVARKDGQTYFLTVHPAATIYNQELVRVLNADIVKLFSLVKELRDNGDITVDIEYSS